MNVKHKAHKDISSCHKLLSSFKEPSIHHLTFPSLSAKAKPPEAASGMAAARRHQLIQWWSKSLAPRLIRMVSLLCRHDNSRLDLHPQKLTKRMVEPGLPDLRYSCFLPDRFSGRNELVPVAGGVSSTQLASLADCLYNGRMHDFPRAHVLPWHCY